MPGSPNGPTDPGLAVAYRIAASVTWADIGARDGKTAKIAKRDAKRLAKKMSAAARLKANAARGVVLRYRAMTIHLRGLAERATSSEQPLGPDVTIPESVNVYIEFDVRSGPVGTATLRRDEQGIWADATIRLDGPHGELMRKAIRMGEFRKFWPKFAIGVRGTVVAKSDAHPMGIIAAGELISLSICRENVDRDLPSYEVVAEGP